MIRQVEMRRQVRTPATTSGKSHSRVNDENQKLKQVVDLVKPPHSAT